MEITMFELNSYKDIFNKRGKEYNYAMELCPHARDQEFLNSIQFLDNNKTLNILDIPSGGGYLRKFIPTYQNLVCAEETDYFYSVCKELPNQQKLKYKINSTIQIKNEYFDCIMSIAGLHHLENKDWIISEMYRLLKRSGEIIISDAEVNSNVSKWLNEFIDSNNSLGHKGIFLDNNFDKLISKTGFKILFSDTIRYSWNFDCIDSMVLYCKNLFGIDKCSNYEILNGIKEYLGFKTESGTIKLNWELKFIHAVKE